MRFVRDAAFVAADVYGVARVAGGTFGAGSYTAIRSPNSNRL
jgi:hypothetical protein